MTMPAGKYYVGDLCYVMHGEWSQFCDITLSGNKVHDGEFALKDGRRFASYSTKWGDGGYSDNEGRSYDVDAGLIGCIRVEDIDLSDSNNFLTSGQVIEFREPFETGGGRPDPLIRFGSVCIDTDPGYEEEEYDCDDLA